MTGITVDEIIICFTGDKLIKTIKHSNLNQLNKSEEINNSENQIIKQNVPQYVLKNVPHDDLSIGNSETIGMSSKVIFVDNDKENEIDNADKNKSNNNNSNKNNNNNNNNNKSNDNNNDIDVNNKDKDKNKDKNDITSTKNINDHSCSHYCNSYLGALQGTRRVTESSQDGCSYACLSIPGNQTVTYTFSLTILENVLSSLPPTDPAVCVENVRIVLRTAIQSDTISTPRDSSNLIELQEEEKSENLSQTEVEAVVEVETLNTTSNLVVTNEKNGNENESGNENKQEFREVILDISPLSSEFRRALQDRSVGKKDGKEKEKNGTLQSPGAYL